MNYRGDPAIGRKGNGFQKLFLCLDGADARGLLAVRFIKQEWTAKNYRPGGYACGHGFCHWH